MILFEFPSFTFQGILCQHPEEECSMCAIRVLWKHIYHAFPQLTHFYLEPSPILIYSSGEIQEQSKSQKTKALTGQAMIRCIPHTIYKCYYRKDFSPRNLRSYSKRVDFEMSNFHYNFCNCKHLGFQGSPSQGILNTTPFMFIGAFLEVVWRLDKEHCILIQWESNSCLACQKDYKMSLALNEAIK